MIPVQYNQVEKLITTQSNREHISRQKNLCRFTKYCDVILMCVFSSYQMRNMALMNSNQISSSGISSSGKPNIFLAAEEIRVDCTQLTSDGRYVVTGSIYGPPQVWDMRVSGP